TSTTDSNGRAIGVRGPSWTGAVGCPPPILPAGGPGRSVRTGQARSLRATTGITIAAATTWVSISTALVPVAASTSTSGTSESAVSATVVRIQVLRGRRA